IFSTGYMRAEFVAIDPSGTGDVTLSHIKWRSQNAPNMPSMVTHQGILYSISDKGIMSCLNVNTGQMINRRRIGGNFSASPLLANGKIYLSSREGVVTVIQCDQNLSTLATNKFDATIMASPAVVDNDLILRTGNRIYRLGETKNIN
ncbi:MAG: hypothetical protein AAGA30_19540, partial [Planctomycetota bacterium]